MDPTKRHNLQLFPSNSEKRFRTLSAISSDSKDSLSRPLQVNFRGWGASYKERGQQRKFGQNRGYAGMEGSSELYMYA